MTRRRRAAFLLGLALVLGTLSAAHMARREAALRAQLGPPAEVVVARRDLPAGRTLSLGDLGVRSVPSRYAPAGGPVYAPALVGEKLAVPVPEGGAVTPALLEVAPAAPEAAVGRGERAVDVIASGSPQIVVAGARVDVVVTTDRHDRARTQLALQDVQVLAAHGTEPAEGSPAPRVMATLRVPVRAAVYLVAAQSFASDIRLLARADGDRRTVDALSVGDGL